MLNLGTVVNALRAVFGSSATAAKLAAAVAVVSVAALPARDEPHMAARRTAVAPAAEASAPVTRPGATTSIAQAPLRAAGRGSAQTRSRAATAAKVPSKPTREASQAASPAASRTAPPLVNVVRLVSDVEGISGKTYPAGTEVRVSRTGSTVEGFVDGDWLSIGEWDYAELSGPTKLPPVT